MRAAAFSPGEVFGAFLLSVIVQAAFVVGIVFAKSGKPPRVEAEPLTLAVSVKPVLDDLPLLKKGGKPNPKKLPDMVKKPPPIERFEENSAPAASAPKEPPPAPLPPVAKAEDAPRPPDAPVVKKADRPPLVVEREPEPNVAEEGTADGAEEGTEADPLKARALSQYQQTVIRWFQRGFVAPVEQIPCATLVSLKVRVRANIGADRTVTRYTLLSTSGNTVFDARVRERMDNAVGQEVPPPPPNYPELGESVVYPTFVGENERCK